MGSDLTVDYLRDLWKQSKPEILFLSETKQCKSYLEKFRLHFGFNNLFTVEPRGSSGGLSLFYNDEIKLRIISSNSRVIDTGVLFKGENIFMSFVYGDPVLKNRHLVWDYLHNISLQRTEPWLLIGDFNEITGNHEKRGGALRSANSFVSFNNMINHCGMLDFHCYGNKLSWRGNRVMKMNDGTYVKQTIRCRLDRALGNEEWHCLFPNSLVRYLKMIGSDHRPILGEFFTQAFTRKQTFRFDKRWLGREGLSEAVIAGWNRTRNFRTTSFVEKIENCRNSISWWRKNNFLPGQVNLTMLKDALEEAKNDDSVSQERILDITRKLQEAYKDEELYWKQKSRNLWLQDGDKNTKYFHAITKQRRARNRIMGLMSNGVWVETDSGIEQIATDYFRELFQAGDSGSDYEIIQEVSPKVTEDMNTRLLRDITEEEVRKALFAMHPEKSPGPDGMTALFYQRFWPSVKDELVSLISNFFRTGAFDKRLNATNICLIPKTERPKGMGEFRPISLCNVSYKIISKVLCLRMKEILPRLISETQSAFVSGRLITDNILVAQEMFHGLRTNPSCKEKFMAIKTDMSKAYDRIEWDFLEKVLIRLGFHEIWISRIMWCVKSVSFQVLINGDPRGLIMPSRGLRQGDPLSPYLFILCTEVLSANLKCKELDKTLTGLKVARGCPAISHLLFADDSLFFCQANSSECEVILGILRAYEKASGQMINFDKSSVLFGHKVPEMVKSDMKGRLGISKEGGMGNYLGIPESLGGSKCKIFSFVNEKLHGRVNGWSSKLLSKGGKEIMIKSVAFALPNHVMSCFRLPQSLTSKLTSAISNFWWGSNGTNNGIHWNAWDNLCLSKNEGGLGFRSLDNFNTALLAKQLWRLYQFPDSLVARVFKGRYYRNTHPLQAPKAYSPSYGWSSLLSARDLLLQGGRMRVGDGKNILVWRDSWLPDEFPRPARGIGKEFYPDLTVNQLFDEDTVSWNIPLLNQLMDPQDVQLIRGLTIRPHLCRDTIIWHFTKSGKYSVKSGYGLAQDMSRKKDQGVLHGPSITPLKAHAWEVKCPTKIKHFIWQVVSGSLAVLSCLKHRGLNLDTLCPRCGLEEETVNHTLFECSTSLQTWSLIKVSNQMNSFPSGSIYVNMDYLFWRLPLQHNDGTDTLDAKEVFPWILWFLWKSRNNKVFQGVEFEPQSIIKLAESECRAWKEAQVKTCHIPTEIAAPRQVGRFCKIDGSWKNSELTSGLGWVCFDGNQVELLGGRGTRQSTSSLHSEFEALIWAMQILLEREIPCFRFLTDCSDLVKIIQDPEDWPAFDILLLVFEELRRRFPEFTLSYIRREENTQADCLARSARLRAFEFSFVNHVPPYWVTNMDGLI